MVKAIGAQNKLIARLNLLAASSSEVSIAVMITQYLATFQTISNAYIIIHVRISVNMHAYVGGYSL